MINKNNKSVKNAAKEDAEFLYKSYFHKVSLDCIITSFTWRYINFIQFFCFEKINMFKVFVPMFIFFSTQTLIQKESMYDVF